MSIEQTILEKVRSLAPEQQQRVLDFADSLTHRDQRSTIADSDRSSEKSIGQPLGDQGATGHVAKTPLGKRLREPRAQIVASGERLLTAEEVEQEIAEQRDLLREFEQ